MLKRFLSDIRSYRQLNKEQKVFLLLMLISIFFIPLFISIFYNSVNNYQETKKKFDDLNFQIGKYQNNKLIQQSTDNPALNDINVDFENIKNLMEENGLTVNQADIKNDQQAAREINCRLSGNYLNFLNFMSRYTRSDFPYLFTAIEINKDKVGVLIDLTLRMES